MTSSYSLKFICFSFFKWYSLKGSLQHKVIGQEFDNVAVVIDKFFFYDSNGDLSYKKETYYNPPKMLFQNITRTRKKIHVVVVVENKEVMSRCLEVFTDEIELAN